MKVVIYHHVRDSLYLDGDLLLEGSQYGGLTVTSVLRALGYTVENRRVDWDKLPRDRDNRVVVLSTVAAMENYFSQLEGEERRAKITRLEEELAYLKELEARSIK